MTAVNTTEQPACGLTHAEHADRWRSWRDDCTVCGYAQQDIQQCATGHPDDGTAWCGACGFSAPNTNDTPTPAVLADGLSRRTSASEAA